MYRYMNYQPVRKLTCRICCWFAAFSMKNVDVEHWTSLKFCEGSLLSKRFATFTLPVPDQALISDIVKAILLFSRGTNTIFINRLKRYIKIQQTWITKILYCPLRSVNGSLLAQTLTCSRLVQWQLNLWIVRITPSPMLEDLVRLRSHLTITRWNIFNNILRFVDRNHILAVNLEQLASVVGNRLSEQQKQNVHVQK